MEKIKLHEIENSLKKKAWKLLSYVFAQYDYKELSHPWGEHWCIFINELDQIFNEQFYPELIELSGLIRALLDVEPIDTGELVEEFDTSVGKLINEGKEEKQLTYREACNKIIHAEEYEVQLHFDSLHPLYNGKNGYEEAKQDRFKNPIIKTVGSFRGQKWTAEINFIKFIERTIQLHK